MSQSFTSNQIYTQPAVNGGRLSLTSGSPVADASAQGTLYWVPYKSSYIALYNGVRWLVINPGEKSLSLTLTSGSVYDIFGYINSSGTLQLESLVWSSTTARATNLTQQNGCYVKSGDATRRYLGTIYASGTNQVTDDTTIRGLWNMDNRVERSLIAYDSTASWSYTTATVRAADNNTSYGQGRFGVVTGLAETLIKCLRLAVYYHTASSGYGLAGIGINSTSADSSNFVGLSQEAGTAQDYLTLHSTLNTMPAIGFTYYQSLETGYAAGGGTCSWTGALALIGMTVKGGMTGSTIQ